MQSLGSVLGAACLVVACASSDDSAPDIGPADSGHGSFEPDSGNAEDSSSATPYDSGQQVEQDTSVGETSAPSSQCMGHCTQDSDCAAVCTPPNGDVACCDTATTMCYVASGMCQPSTSQPDSGMPAGY